MKKRERERAPTRINKANNNAHAIALSEAKLQIIMLLLFRALVGS